MEREILVIDDTMSSNVYYSLFLGSITILPLGQNQTSQTIRSQVARSVNRFQKMLHRWDPLGIITTYQEYQKTMVSNSDRQPLARNQADKVPAELHHLGLPGSNISAKVIEQNVFNGDCAW